jgi:adenosine deaminase
VDTIQNYPFLRFQKSGIAISINTDNRTVSDTTCTKELELLYDHFGLTDEMLRKIYRDSVEMSFAADEIKHELLRVVWNPGNP